MTFREKVVVSILFLIAQMFCDDDEVRRELKRLSTHVSVHAKDPAA